MTTLKERFTQQCFCTDKALETATGACTYDKGEILFFFRQELLALAEEVEKGIVYASDAATLIRSKADELCYPHLSQS